MARREPRPPAGFPPMADDDPDDEPQLDEPGATPRTRRTSTRDFTGRSGGASVTPTLRPPSRLSVADGAGFALGLLLYAIGFAYLEEGPYGVRRWFSAKFVNDVLPRKS